MPKFGTLEWGQELKRLWNADQIVLKLLKGFSTTMITKISDKPEMKPVFLRIEDGKLTEVRYAEPDYKAEFVYEASMEVWRDVLEGKIDPTKATLLGKLKLTGPLTSLTKYMKGWVRAMDLLRKASTEW